MRHYFRIWFFAVLALCGIAGGLAGAADDKNNSKRPVYILTMDGAIGPAFSAYLDAGLAKAAKDNAQLLVIELNTPGGLLSTTREMATSIVESRTPIAVWVTPSGAHAASAGTFILYAAHIAAMDEGTNVGAATPVEARGQLGEPVEQKDARDKKPSTTEQQEKDLQQMMRDMMDPNAKAMRQKAVEDTAAFIRGLAELRGRNAEWGEKAVTEALSITAKEALEKDVIDLIATSRAEFLEKVDGKSLPIKNAAAVKLDTKDAPVIEMKPDWKTRLLATITDPNIALILMTIGFYGLIIEFYNPGSMIPGTIGAISLVLGLYAMNVLPLNTAGIVLMVLGVAFMIAEAFIPSFGIMGLAGVAALVTGAVIMFDTEGMPGMGVDPGVIAGIGLAGLLIVALLVFVTAKAYKRKTSTGTESMVGAAAHVIEWSGREGSVRLQGEIWHAVSDQVLDLKKDDLVTIDKVEELTLRIRADR